MALHVLVHNPAAGRGRSTAVAADTAAVLRSAGHEVEVHGTRGPGDAPSLVADRVGRGPAVDAVVALGGDGTLNEVAWGVVRAGAAPRVPVGVVPLGTTNVIARDLGIPLDPRLAAVTLAFARPRAFDLGTCEAGGVSRPFLLACGIGFEAEAAATVTPREKRWFGPAGYAVAGLRRILHPPVPLALDFLREDGSEERDVPAESAIVGNARLYGGFARLARTAAFDDGVLELAWFPRARPWPLLRAALTGIASELAACPAVRLARVRRVTIRGSSPVRGHVDAEPCIVTPATFGVIRHGVSLLAPR